MRSPNGLLRQGALVVLLASIGACASPTPRTPSGAVGSYATAIREGRLEDAYRLLSQESRRDLSFAEFKTLIESSPQEVEALLREVEKQQAPPRVTAELTTRDGRTLLLIYEDGAWRIDESAVDIYGQSEPRQALRSFLLAYDNERYDVLLRFVPEAEAEGLTDKLLKEAWEGEQRLEIEQVVEALRPVVDNGNLEVLGEQASMSYGAGATVELVFEHGSWKIEDF